MEITADPGVPLVLITRRFDAPRALVFRAYTEPDLVARWLGPAGLTLTVNQLDPRHGGRWRWTHYDSDGKGFVFHGPYHGTPSPERIVQTYEFDLYPGVVYLNTITFDENDGVTTLRQSTVFPTVEDRDVYVEGGTETGTETGIRASMDQLDALVAQLVKE